MSGGEEIHATTSIIINNSDISITKSEEGIEGKFITYNSGNIIVFKNNGKNLLLNDFAVIKLKLGTLNIKPKLGDSLKNNRIYPLGFSKYCMGRALSESNLKKNMFKSKTLKINRQHNLVSL